MAGSSSWDKRNARAQALGYRNYYDYRVHDNGRIAPERRPLRGERLTRARGHRGAADFRTLLQSGRVDLLTMIDVERNAAGQVTAIHVQTITAEGKIQSWRLTGDAADPRRFVAIIEGIDPGVPLQLVGSPRLINTLRRGDRDEDELDELEAEAEQALEDANYRPARSRSRRCGTCSFYAGGWCDMFDTAVDPDYVCDEWSPRPKRRR